MSPISLFLILMLVTLVGWVADRLIRRRCHAAYRQLAIAYKMHYSPGDPLRLTPRIAARLPIPGAAAVRVIDLLYRTDEENHYYVFTAEYTVGVVGPKCRVRRAAAFTESKLGGEPIQLVRLGPPELSLVEQYRLVLSGTSVLSEAGTPAQSKDPGSA